LAKGEQVAPLCRPLLDRFHVNIHFAHRTFTWESEARGKAHVHVVIIGFAAFPGGSKKIYDYEDEALYDALAMPRDLARAHAELDRAVERSYRREEFQSDLERVEFLLQLYERLTAPLLPATAASTRRDDGNEAVAHRDCQQHTAKSLPVTLADLREIMPSATIGFCHENAEIVPNGCSGFFR
jgi:hypothetical protein